MVLSVRCRALKADDLKLDSVFGGLTTEARDLCWTLWCRVRLSAALRQPADRPKVVTFIASACGVLRSPESRDSPDDEFLSLSKLGKIQVGLAMCLPR